MEYRIEIIKNCKDVMDHTEAVQSLLDNMGIAARAEQYRDTEFYDVYVTIDDMHAWLSRAAWKYGVMKIKHDLDDKMVIILGYDVM